jgi:5-methylthioribose kinase
MIRRIVGIAHVADLDSISDAAARAGCERRALRFGRSLLVTPGQYSDVVSLVKAAEAAAGQS